MIKLSISVFLISLFSTCSLSNDKEYHSAKSELLLSLHAIGYDYAELKSCRLKFGLITGRTCNNVYDAGVMAIDINIAIEDLNIEELKILEPPLSAVDFFLHAYMDYDYAPPNETQNELDRLQKQLRPILNSRNLEKLNENNKRIDALIKANPSLNWERNESCSGYGYDLNPGLGIIGTNKNDLERLKTSLENINQNLESCKNDK